MKALEILSRFKTRYESAYSFDGTMVVSLEDIIVAIEELEATKSCEGCAFEDYEDSYWVCCMCSRNVSDKYEPKDSE